MTSFLTQRAALFLVQTKRYVNFLSGLPHSFGSPLSTPFISFKSASDSHIQTQPPPVTIRVRTAARLLFLEQMFQGVFLFSVYFRYVTLFCARLVTHAVLTPPSSFPRF